MNSTRIFRTLGGAAPWPRVQGRRNLSTLGRLQPSPFLELFTKYRSQNVIPRRITRRNFTTRTRLRTDNPKAAIPPVEPSKSLSQRLKDLSKEYGWTAVGVYFALSALDFPFCFLAVRWIGTEKIMVIEHRVVEWVKKAIPIQIPPKYRFWQKTEAEQTTQEAEVQVYDHGYKEAEQAHARSASLGTQLALAYAIHKSFIFIRVPLTAAILPKIVKTLRSWGWKVGKKKPKVEIPATKPIDVVP